MTDSVLRLTKGTKINNYEIVSIVEETSCSVIYGIISPNFKKLSLKIVNSCEPCKSNAEHELIILQTIQHPNICQLLDSFVYQGHNCFVFPYYQNISVMKLMLSQYPQGIPEKIASRITYQILEAVNCLHQANICHNNITCENIMVLSENPINVQLCGFEHSIYMIPDQGADSYVGAPDYSAPEKISRTPYNKSVDIWSIGVSLFVMLSGKYPFPSYHKFPKECTNNILAGNLNYDLLRKQGISHGAINLIQEMCPVNPSNRITAENALNDPWIVANNRQ